MKMYSIYLRGSEGQYEHVGAVDATNLEEAFVMTQNIDERPNALGNCRSTSVGDIFVEFDLDSQEPIPYKVEVTGFSISDVDPSAPGRHYFQEKMTEQMCAPAPSYVISFEGVDVELESARDLIPTIVKLLPLYDDDTKFEVIQVIGNQEGIVAQGYGEEVLPKVAQYIFENY